MRKFAMMLLVILFCAQAFAETDLLWEEIEQATKKFAEMTPSIISMGYDRSDDLDMQLGLAFLLDYHLVYVRQDLPEGELDVRPEIWLDRALAIDPDNKAALAVKSFRCFQHYYHSEPWKSFWELKQDIGSQYVPAQKSFKIGTWLFDFFKQEVDIDPEKVRHTRRFKYYINWDSKEGKFYEAVIKQEDYDKAINKLTEYIIAEETKPLIKEIDSIIKIDPQNALYDYLKANIYFSLGKMQKGLAEVRKGSRKDVVNSYVQERSNAMVYVLEQFPFSGHEIELIIDISMPMESNLVHSRIWKERLDILGSDLENKGEYKKAQEIYELVVKAMDQCEHERRRPFTGTSKAQQRLEKVKKKMQAEQEERKAEKI